MLTDIFARRYEQPRMWETFYEESRRLLVQGWQLLNDICPRQREPARQGFLDSDTRLAGERAWPEGTVSAVLGLPQPARSMAERSIYHGGDVRNVDAKAI
jgi:hypothetical protein